MFRRDERLRDTHADTISSMPVSDYESTSFVGRDDIVDDVIQRAFSVNSQSRIIMIEGPANRGKSWLLCRTQEKLQNSATRAATALNYPPIVPCFFTSDHASPFEPLRLIAWVWWFLHPYLSDLSLPAHITDSTQTANAVEILHNQFIRDGADAQTRILQVTNKIEAATSPIILALLVDGLDEFDDPELFVRHFVEPLVRSPNVRLVVSLRSQVRTARWQTFSIRRLLRKDDQISLGHFDVLDAKEQINRYFELQGAPLSFANLVPLFRHYTWQNPGANRRLADCAIANQNRGAQTLISGDDVRDCLMHLSLSNRFDHPISGADFDWLTAVVGSFPTIGSSEVPSHKLNEVLTKVAQHHVGDLERNAWIGRLQERAIVVHCPNGQCLVYEEFAALCQEWEAQRTP